MDSQTQRWLASMPNPDRPQHGAPAGARTWEAWVSAGRTIPGLEAELADLLVGEPDEFRRARAATALGFVGGEASVPPLIGALRDGVPAVAMEAAAALGRLGRLGRLDAVRPLCGALEHPDVNVRANAATALGHFDDETARDCLDRASHDPDPFVRAAADSARGDR